MSSVKMEESRREKPVRRDWTKEREQARREQEEQEQEEEEEERERELVSLGYLIWFREWEGGGRREREGDDEAGQLQSPSRERRES